MWLLDADGLKSSLKLGIQENELLELFFEYSWVFVLLNDRVGSAENESMSDWLPVFVDFIVRIEPDEVLVVCNLIGLDLFQISCASFILNRNLDLGQHEINGRALIQAIFCKFCHICAILKILYYTVYVGLYKHFDCALLENCLGFLREEALEIFTALSTKMINGNQHFNILL